ncbi:hypothetical protein BpHYR1_051940 [Brachionus plicatilis]|uniref:Uncharacterized protein n=1 Tax=Brachionus plicatilis TaxID=10195 RepID=A0A3M7R0U2_BRAPC|nr:hypothetical protein BpHYR1_051940 [Brachionus plicatilis]
MKISDDKRTKHELLSLVCILITKYLKTKGTRYSRSDETAYATVARFFFKTAIVFVINAAQVYHMNIIFSLHYFVKLFLVNVRNGTVRIARPHSMMLRRQQISAFANYWCRWIAQKADRLEVLFAKQQAFLISTNTGRCF